MQYEKPEMVAQNATGGSFAAGCPANERGSGSAGNKYSCINCERTQ